MRMKSIFILLIFVLCFSGCFKSNQMILAEIRKVQSNHSEAVVYVQKDNQEKVIYRGPIEPMGGEMFIVGPLLSPDNKYSLFNIIYGETGYLLFVNNANLTCKEFFGDSFGLGCCCPIWFSDSERILYFGYSPLSRGAFIYNCHTEELIKRDDMWDLNPDCHFIPEWTEDGIVLKLAFAEDNSLHTPNDSSEIIYREYNLEEQNYISNND